MKETQSTKEIVDCIEISGKILDFIYETKASLQAYVLGKIYCVLFFCCLSANEVMMLPVQNLACR